jgi:hypothetical protein
MLETYDRHQPVRFASYPAQVVRFGDDLAILALGGEVVLDYSIRAKKEYANLNLVVAGYSNDVMSYIPSLRVLREGGYEATDAMIYYEMPGPYTEKVEEEIFQLIHRTMDAAGLRPSAN